MAIKGKYTQEEEQIIAEEVSLHQTNIKRGLIIASERLGRSFNSVHKHWYAVQSKKEIVSYKYNDRVVPNIEENMEPISYLVTESTRPGIFSRILKWLLKL